MANGNYIKAAVIGLSERQIKEILCSDPALCGSEIRNMSRSRRKRLEVAGAVIVAILRDQLNAFIAAARRVLPSVEIRLLREV